MSALVDRSQNILSNQITAVPSTESSSHAALRRPRLGPLAGTSLSFWINLIKNNNGQ